MTVYLDHNATSTLRPEARAAVLRALDLGGNASSVHAPGRAAKAMLENAREQVAASVGACAEDVVFTSGGTEANNLALRGGLAASGLRRLIVSAIEHDSVLETAKALAREGVDVAILPVTRDGVADLDALAPMLDAGPALLALMLANNETGVMQPVAEAAHLVHEAGGRVHVDAAQAFGRVSISMIELGADTLALSAHKAGGPVGAGALVLGSNQNGGATLARIQHGGRHERGHRAGTENLPSIAGFGAVAELGLWDAARLKMLRGRLEAELKADTPEIEIYGEKILRLPNTSCFAAPGFAGETQVMALDLAGVAVSAGSACSSGKTARSHVLDAMGAGPMAACAIRVSLGWSNTEDDVAHFIGAWRAAYARVKARAA